VVDGSFPVRDGALADEEGGCGLLAGPAQQALDLDDAEALGRAVVRAVPFRDLGQPRLDDVKGVPGELGLQLGLLQAALEVPQGVILGAGLAQCRPVDRPRRFWAWSSAAMAVRLALWPSWRKRRKSGGVVAIVEGGMGLLEGEGPGW